LPRSTFRSQAGRGFKVSVWLIRKTQLQAGTSSPKQYLDGISAYWASTPERHWHFVTYGMTELYFKEEGSDPEYRRVGLRTDDACTAGQIPAPGTAAGSVRGGR
jgi:hypothetical protein